MAEGGLYKRERERGKSGCIMALKRCLGKATVAIVPKKKPPMQTQGGKPI
jgi:hypothetical protein